MENVADNIHIGELIAISKVFKLNTYQTISLLEKGLMEVFEDKEAFLKKYGKQETYLHLDWCELNNGKIFTKLK